MKHSLYYRCVPWLIGHCSNYIPRKNAWGWVQQHHGETTRLSPEIIHPPYQLSTYHHVFLVKTISYTGKKNISTCQLVMVKSPFFRTFPQHFPKEPTFFSTAPCPSAPGSAPDSSHAKHRAGRLGAVLKPWSIATGYSMFLSLIFWEFYVQLIAVILYVMWH